MTPIRPLSRPALSVLLVLALAGTSGCGWLRTKFGNDSLYRDSRQNAPLEVPPGLDAPSTAGAVVIPAAPAGATGLDTSVPGMGSADAAPAEGVDNFMLEDTVESSWRRIGLALGKIEGVTVDDRAQLLNSYGVSYQGGTMLIRAEAAGGGTRVVALGADGRPLTSAAARQLLGLLKARLG